MLCCRKPTPSSGAIRRLMYDGIKLFQFYRIYRSPEAMDELRAHYKMISYRLMQLQYCTQSEPATDELDDATVTIGRYFIARAVWLQVDPALAAEAWGQLRAQLNEVGGWDPTYSAFKGDCNDMLEWIDKNLYAYYEAGYYQPKDREEENQDG